jgi:hypothetical protein
MKVKDIISITTVMSFFLFNGIAYCNSDQSYSDTVDVIMKTMAGSTSDYRKESYGYIRLNKCSLDYSVSGTYPVGDLYTIRYSNIDFSSLNYEASKAGHDYTAFIILNFKNPIKAKDRSNDLTIHTVVVNVSDDEKAQILFKAFLHLGELCGARKSHL